MNNFRSLVLILLIATLTIIFGAFFLPSQNAQANIGLTAKYSEFASSDRITRDIRNVDKHLLRVNVKSHADRSALSELGSIVSDHGSFVVLAIDKSKKLDEARFDLQTISSEISLPALKVDPLKSRLAGTINPGASSSSTSAGYYIVQFGGIVTDKWLDSLRDVGVEILQYVPHNAFYVYGSGDAISRAASHSRVRWIGEFRPEFKLTDMLSDQIAAAKQGVAPRNNVSPLFMKDETSAIFDVAIFARADAETVASEIATNYGGRAGRVTELPNSYFNMLTITLPLDQVKNVAKHPDVITIDRYGVPEKEDERAAQIVAGNYTSTTALSPPGYDPLTQFGADGTGVTISMVDDGVSVPGTGGFYITSANTVDGPLRGAAAGATGGHGHINASIISGYTPFGILDPTGYNYGLGIAPRSNIINIPLLVSGYNGSYPETYSDTVTTVGPNGAKGTISNNSWGNGTNSNVYDSYTAQFDGFVRDASSSAGIDPIVLVFSAGNSGPTALSLTRPKASKNMIAVGNSENIRTELGGTSANNMDDLRNSSSRGPAADGRVKPDIVAPGTYITGGRAGNCSSVSSCFDPNHAFSSGTSHAAPQVAGAAALFTQYWRNNNNNLDPSPALVKAAVISTAQEMNGASTGTAIPNGNEGWGRINMKLMLPSDVPVERLDQTVAFGGPGESQTITGTVIDATKPVRVTLVWTDPPGAANANPALVNNLDLNVTVGANSYKGNVLTNGSSSTGGSSDTINNVENIYLPAGIAAGTAFSITVSAIAINGDGILGNADTTDQHFALVAYNFSPQNGKARADFDGDGRTDLSVYRPTQGNWYVERSTAGFSVQQWGLSTDVPVPADYDGDGKTDYAIFRAETDPTKQDFYILNSSNGTFSYAVWGLPGDQPIVGDFDGDEKADLTLYRPDDNFWYIAKSSGGFSNLQFGSARDIPFGIDSDGDGKTNLAVFRPSTKTWYIARPEGLPSENFDAVQFGLSTDLPVPADYDGDNKDDIAVFRPTDGLWFILHSTDGLVETIQYGLETDIPVPGDYDGDGRDDVAVYRNGTWFLNRSTSGGVQIQFGLSSDIPIPKKYIP